MKREGTISTAGRAKNFLAGQQQHLGDFNLLGESKPGLLTPKRPQTETAGLADTFPYYAGFSFEWARRYLREYCTQASEVILDPWNGSGTTTLAARILGKSSIGVDLNPVANIAAQFRSLAIESYAASVVRPPPAADTSLYRADPLLAWFDLSTASRLRLWANAVAVGAEQGRLLGRIALFRVVRNATRSFQGSNPTWVRRISPDREAISISSSDLDELIVAEQAFLAERVASTHGVLKASTAIVRSSATRLPVRSDSVSHVLTSPPYLTRIDYAASYARELAVLGIDILKNREMRSGLMGTTLIRPPATPAIRDGSIASRLLTAIQNHDSKASGGYYFKQANQYLGDLTMSLQEISRVCSVGATATFVVQDSYYKDIPIRLADICEEEASHQGWSTLLKQPYEVRRTLTSLNTAARAYPKGSVSETVLTVKLERKTIVPQTRR